MEASFFQCLIDLKMLVDTVFRRESVAWHSIRKRILLSMEDNSFNIFFHFLGLMVYGAYRLQSVVAGDNLS